MTRQQGRHGLATVTSRVREPARPALADQQRTAGPSTLDEALKVGEMVAQEEKRKREPKTVQEQILQLEARIREIQNRANLKAVLEEAKRRPEIAHARKAFALLLQAADACLASKNTPLATVLADARIVLQRYFTDNRLPLTNTAAVGKTDAPMSQTARGLAAEAVFERVHSNPGERSEQIAAALRLSSKQASAGLHVLRDAQRIRMTGTRRGARYYPV